MHNLERHSPEWDREAEAVRTEIRDRLIVAVVSHLPRRFCEAKADHPDVLAWVGELADDARQMARMPGHDIVRNGPSLLLTGPVGTGKTYQCCGALRALAEASVQPSFRMVTTADLYGQLRPSAGADTEQVLHDHLNAGLLILDDIGANKDSEWTEEILYRLVNHRYLHELPTMFTTNVPPKQLPGVVGDRVASRLLEMCRIVPLTGADRRRKIRAAA